MKLKAIIIGVIASLALTGLAMAQQTGEPGMKQSRKSSSAQEKAMTKNPDTVKQVQHALSDKGFYKGPDDGKWGRKTISALKRFQTAQGMKATGRLDQATLTSLGIGAATGGQETTPSNGDMGAAQKGGNY